MRSADVRSTTLLPQVAGYLTSLFDWCPPLVDISFHCFFIMAKSTGFFSLRRGSTKSLTFSVLDGKQITKDRVSIVRNPKTEAQQIQRTLMNTVVQAYSLLKPICDHSFEGVQVGRRSMQEFVKRNANIMRSKLTVAGTAYGAVKAFCPIGRSYVAPNEFVVSDGSLPKVYATPNMQLFIAANTYQGMLTEWGLKAGDQITILALSDFNGDGNPDFDYCRIILTPQENGENAPLSSAFVDENGVILSPNYRNENTSRFRFVYDADGHLDIAIAGDTDPVTPDAVAIIVSRKAADGSWLRSKAAFVLGKSVTGLTLDDALAADSDRSLDSLSALYLNNASTSNATPVAIPLPEEGKNIIYWINDNSVVPSVGGLGMKIAHNVAGYVGQILVNGQGALWGKTAITDVEATNYTDRKAALVAAIKAKLRVESFGMIEGSETEVSATLPVYAEVFSI